MLKTLKVDGVEYVCFIDRASGDGGRVINYLSPDGNGSYYNFRHWFSDPAVALAAFDGIDEATVRDREAKAKAIDERTDTTVETAR